MKVLIKVLPVYATNSSGLENDVLRIKDITFPSEVDGEVFLVSKEYEELFGNKKKTSRNSQKRLSVVKISANGHSIHRAYRGISAANFTREHVGLTPNSIMLLCDKEGNAPVKVSISKGCVLQYYWNHPDKAVRISVILGSLSLFLGLISLIITLIQLLIQMHSV